MGMDDVLRRCVSEHERRISSMKPMQEQLEDIFRPTQQPGRYYKQACGGRLCIKTVGIKLKNVIVVRDLDDPCGKMKFH
jgi:hypothetical protein